MNQVKELEATECVRLLGQRGVGRAAVGTPDGPHLVPVNYALLDDTIVIRTSPYSLLGTYARTSRLAFEVDQLDEANHSGWSVVVQGRCVLETDPKTLARLRHLLPESWASGTRTLYLRLPLEEISGRAVGAIRMASMVGPCAVGAT